MQTRLLFFLLFFPLQATLAQVNGWNWPEDKATAQEKKVLYTDYMAHGDYLSATEPLEWLISHAPDLNKSLYIHGASIYQKLAESTEDATLRAQYKKRALRMFDMRIEHFDDKGNVLNRKAYVAYHLYKDAPVQYPMLLTLFREAIANNGVAINAYNLLAYMDVLQREKKSGRTTAEDIISAYMEIKDILSAQAVQDDSERLNNIAEGVDKIFVASVRVDCRFIHNRWAPQLTADNLQIAKHVVNFLLIADCTSKKDNALFLRAAKILYDEQSTVSMAKVIAKKSMLIRDYTTAIDYYRRALDGMPSEDADVRAGLHLGLAKAHASLEQRVKARRYALLAANNPTTAEGAYNLVGGLYLSSYERCKKGVSRVEDRAIYIAAYNMFQRAGNQKMMRVCAKQFPTVADMFELGKSEGDVINISCWFNEEVSLRRTVE